MLKRRPIHPILFALYPVLALYSLNTALVPVSHVVVPLVAILSGTCVLWLVLGLILRSVARGALAASVVVTLTFLCGHVWDLFRTNAWLSWQIDDRGLFAEYWVILTVLALIAASWKWKKSEAITGVANIVGAVLVALPMLSILASWFTAFRGTPVAELSAQNHQLKVTDRPDIYYIILDGYGRQDSLKRVIGYDDTWFLKALQDRGFFVAKDGRSNYCQTELSLSSSLNMDYLQSVLPAAKPDWTDRKILDRLINNNNVSKYLRKLGYRYEAVTTGFPSVNPYSADLWMNPTEGMTYFGGVLLAETPMPIDSSLAGSQFITRRDYIHHAFDYLSQMGVGGTQPRFIFTHILAPHPPFVFGPNGESVRPHKMGFTYADGSDFMDYGGTPAMYKAGYSDQAEYMSKLVIAAVDQIVRKSKETPIIIIQGDHGSKLKLNQQILEKTDVNECFPNLNALLVPPQVRANLYDGLTPVNSFRMIFNGLFGDRFERLPDKSYYSGWLTPYNFIDVTKRINPAP